MVSRALSVLSESTQIGMAGPGRARPCEVMPCGKQERTQHRPTLGEAVLGLRFRRVVCVHGAFMLASMWATFRVGGADDCEPGSAEPGPGRACAMQGLGRAGHESCRAWLLVSGPSHVAP